MQLANIVKCISGHPEMLFPQCFKVSVSVHFLKPFLGSRVNPRLPLQCRSFCEIASSIDNQ